MSERNHVLQMENITMQFGGVVGSITSPWR